MSDWTENGQVQTIHATETFQLTPRLRWAMTPVGTIPMHQILQQCWQGSRGTQRWENVPVVDAQGIDR